LESFLHQSLFIQFTIQMKICFIFYSIIFIKFQWAQEYNYPKQVEVKIKDDWEDKRQFIYLKNIEVKNRFVLKSRKMSTLQNINDDIVFNRIESLEIFKFNTKTNAFYVEITNGSEFIPNMQLKKKIVIQIINHPFIQHLIPKLDNQVV